MRHWLAITAVGAAFFLAPAQAADPALQNAPRAAGAGHGLPLLLAQSERARVTCKDDEKEMPRGSTVCRMGKLLRCGARGTWEDTRKPC